MANYTPSNCPCPEITDHVLYNINNVFLHFIKLCIDLGRYNRFMKAWKLTRKIILLCIIVCFLASSIASPLSTTAAARLYTSPYSFNYATWVLQAFAQKIGEAGLDVTSHLPGNVQHAVVIKYFKLARDLDIAEWSIEQIYADPAVPDPEQAAAEKIAERDELQTMLTQMAPVVEEILEYQVRTVLAEEGLDLGGQNLPPVLYHTSPVPKALILSPHDTIRQDADISLQADISMEDITALENEVEEEMSVSALVVDIGGVGVYPTMVMRSSSLVWVVQTIAHEWTHNYLSLHPLGINYGSSGELRTMNETTAAIVGEEVSRLVLERYYPEMAASSTKVLAMTGSFQEKPFDFNAEMHQTRVTVDFLLSQGRVKAAESYMEARRQTFWENGYLIRKLNQAYFAFYGAYADTPQGAAGGDPVGPAVRALREQSGSLSVFIKQIAWMNSYSDLQEAVGSQAEN